MTFYGLNSIRGKVIKLTIFCIVLDFDLNISLRWTIVAYFRRTLWASNAPHKGSWQNGVPFIRISIFSDSQAAIKSLSNVANNFRIVREYRRCFYLLSGRLSVPLIWVHGPCDIPETAEQTSKPRLAHFFWNPHQSTCECHFPRLNWLLPWMTSAVDTDPLRKRRILSTFSVSAHHFARCRYRFVSSPTSSIDVKDKVSFIKLFD